MCLFWDIAGVARGWCPTSVPSKLDWTTVGHRTTRWNPGGGYRCQECGPLIGANTPAKSMSATKRSKQQEKSSGGSSCWSKLTTMHVRKICVSDCTCAWATRAPACLPRQQNIPWRVSPSSLYGSPMHLLVCSFLHVACVSFRQALTL
jgi:hypothetical protein